MDHVYIPNEIVCYRQDLAMADLVRNGILASAIDAGTHSRVRLLPGWTHVPGAFQNHAIVGTLLDPQQRIRLVLYHDATFVARRFIVHEHHNEGFTAISAQEKRPLDILFKAGICRRNDHYSRDDLRAQARAWLDTNRPDHLNPFAYWND